MHLGTLDQSPSLPYFTHYALHINHCWAWQPPLSPAHMLHPSPHPKIGGSMYPLICVFRRWVPPLSKPLLPMHSSSWSRASKRKERQINSMPCAMDSWVLWTMQEKVLPCLQTDRETTGLPTSPLLMPRPGWRMCALVSSQCWLHGLEPLVLDPRRPLPFSTTRVLDQKSSF